MVKPLTGVDLVYVEPLADLRRQYVPNASTKRERVHVPRMDGAEALLVQTAIVRDPKYTDSKRNVPILREPIDIAYLTAHLADVDQEHIVTIALSAKGALMAIHEAGIGGTSTGGVEAMHALKLALLTGADRIALVHNHPGGKPGPSEEDIVLTESLSRLAKCVGVRFWDHVIVAHSGWYSFRAAGMISGHGDDIRYARRPLGPTFPW